MKTEQIKHLMHMSLRSAVQLCLALTLLTTSALAQSPPPIVEIIDLGFIDGGGSFPFSVAFGLNDAGEVVGWSKNGNATFQIEAFLWDATNGMQGLGFIDGGGSSPFSEAFGVNDAGQVVGQSSISSGLNRAFLWDVTNGMQSLGLLSGGFRAQSVARGVNDTGEVVGGSRGSFGRTEAFIWDATNGMQGGLGFVNGGGPFPSSQAWSVNDVGQIVGESRNGVTIIQSEAFLWDATNGMQGLGFIDGGGSSPLSRAFGVSNAGQVVGESRNSANQNEAFLWDATNGMQGLGFIDGGGSLPFSVALGVNDVGQIVGRSADSTSTPVAFLFENGQMHDLNLLLPPGSGWRLTDAKAINDAGDIVGAGLKIGQVHAFLARLGPNTDTNTPPTCAITSPGPGPFMVNFGDAINVIVTTNDDDGDELSVSLSVSPAADPSSSPTLNFDGVNATFSWTPTVNDLGQHTVTITVDDGTAQASCSFDVCVVNLPPGCVQGESAFIINVGNSFSHVLIGQDENLGDVLTVSHLGLPEGASITPEASSVGDAPMEVTFNWTPQADVDQFGQHDITIRFTDATGAFADCVFSVFVVNRVPECVPDPQDNFVLFIGETFSTTITAEDGDPGDELLVTATGLPGDATVTQFGANPADAVFDWVPTVLDVGTYPIDVTFIDINGDSAVCSFFVQVTNRPPLCELSFDELEFPPDDDGGMGGGLPGPPGPLQTSGLTLTVGQTFTATFTGTDEDPGDTLELIATGVPASATLTHGDGTSGSSPLAAVFEWAPLNGDARPEPYIVAITFVDFNGAVSICILDISVNRSPIAECIAGPTEGEGEVGASISVECDAPSGRFITLDGSASTDPDGDDLFYTWDVSDDAVILDDENAAVTSGEFPVGITMATLTVADGRGGVAICDVLIIVVDTTPPEVMCTTDVGSLWPPKHNMMTVTLIVVATDECAEPDFIFPLQVLVSTDEEDDANGVGDGNTTGDVNGQDGYTSPVDVTSFFTWNAALTRWEGTIELRAERDGTGDGRKYTIDITAMDSLGNVGEASCCIVVPHDRRGGGGNNN